MSTLTVSEQLDEAWKRFPNFDGDDDDLVVFALNYLLANADDVDEVLAPE